MTPYTHLFLKGFILGTAQACAWHWFHVPFFFYAGCVNAERRAKALAGGDPAEARYQTRRAVVTLGLTGLFLLAWSAKSGWINALGLTGAWALLTYAFLAAAFITKRYQWAIWYRNIFGGGRRAGERKYYGRRGSGADVDDKLPPWRRRR